MQLWILLTLLISFNSQKIELEYGEYQVKRLSKRTGEGVGVQDRDFKSSLTDSLILPDSIFVI